MRRLSAFLAAAVVVFAGGCDRTPPASGVTSAARTSVATPPTASPAATLPLAIMQTGQDARSCALEGGSGASGYGVELVNLMGGAPRSVCSSYRGVGCVVQCSVQPSEELPLVSASNDRLYYLDGRATVRFLGLDEQGGVAYTLPVGPTSEGGFAVSPDDSRIAVTIADYGTAFHMHMYVEDLSGGGHHVDLFDSTSVLEWPVGWHAGHLVIKLAQSIQGINFCDFVTPTSKAEYRSSCYAEHHVADATTGKRLATICPESSYGFSGSLPTPAGIECEVGDPPGGPHRSLLETWDGNQRIIPSDACGVAGPLSPDGLWIATRELPQQPDGSCNWGATSITLVDLSGNRKDTGIAGTPQGWIDSSHLVISDLGIQYGVQPIYHNFGGWAIADVNSGRTVPIDAPGACVSNSPIDRCWIMVGVLPGNLG